MEQINGFYDDNGNHINPELIRKPGLCILCLNNDIDDPIEDMLCAMARLDQKDADEFT